MSYFVISRIIKVSVRVISFRLRLRLITSTLIILDITKNSYNICLLLVHRQCNRPLECTLQRGNDFNWSVLYNLFNRTMTFKFISCSNSVKNAIDAQNISNSTLVFRYSRVFTVTPRIHWFWWTRNTSWLQQRYRWKKNSSLLVTRHFFHCQCRWTHRLLAAPIQVFFEKLVTSYCKLCANIVVLENNHFAYRLIPVTLCIFFFMITDYTVEQIFFVCC